MSLTIHVIVASGGEYDSAWEENHSAFILKDKAVEEQERLYRQRDRLRKIERQISDAYYTVLKVQPVDEPCPPAPKGPSKSTKESMEKYQAACVEWRKIVQPIYERRAEAQAQVYAQAVEAARSVAMALDCDDEDLRLIGLIGPDGCLALDKLDVDYHIEELQLT